MKKKPKFFIDVTSYSCPMNFVKVKIMLEKMSPGDQLEVKFKGKEAYINLPKSTVECGHKIISLVNNSEHLDRYTLLISHC